MKISKELLEKAKTAKSAEELLEMAKTEKIELTAEEAAKAFAELNKIEPNATSTSQAKCIRFSNTHSTQSSLPSYRILY